MAGSPASPTQLPGVPGPPVVTPPATTPPAATSPAATPTSTPATRTSAGSVLDLGGRRHDLTHRALVMGILNRTPDSFYDKGATYELDALYRRAAELVADGADILDLGGVKAGPGPDVTESEEMERVVPVVGELVARFDAPVSIDTWRAPVARASYAEGALMGNDISGFADPDYLAAAAEYGAAVVATHIRLAPRVADPDPQYGDVVVDVRDFLVERAERAEAAGVPAERIVLDAGLDLGKTAAQSLTLLRASSTLAGLGYPLLLSASNKTFLGATLDLGITERREASLAAAALGLSWGCRILRVHDVKGTRRVRDAIAAVSAAR
jgi:dihydropteroate synthase